MIADHLRWLAYRPDHVVAAIQGGLGNQLFQYAAGRALSRRLGLPLKLDYADGNDAWGRRYELERLGVQAPRLDDRERTAWLGRGATTLTQRRLCRAVDRLLLHRRIVERPRRIDARLVRRRRPAFLHGLWQSEAYFRDQAPALRRELLARRQETDSAPGAAELDAPDTVAVHVRRGDYLDPAVRRIMGVCPPGYYARAADRLRAEVGRFRCYIFTNDVDWVAAQPDIFGLGPIMPARFADPAFDLLLMSRCHHFITANSSFSWWAAWLGQRAGSRVICPAPWFASDPAAQPRIVPAGWTSLLLAP